MFKVTRNTETSFSLATTDLVQTRKLIFKAVKSEDSQRKLLIHSSVIPTVPI